MPKDPVVINWDNGQLDEFLNDPNGELGRDLFTRLGDVVAAGAKARALVRTGRMKSLIYSEVVRDEKGLVANIISPVLDPETHKPYASFHEFKKTRDRRPHRSLRPALRDIRKIVS